MCEYVNITPSYTFKLIKNCNVSPGELLLSQSGHTVPLPYSPSSPSCESPVFLYSFPHFSACSLTCSFPLRNWSDGHSDRTLCPFSALLLERVSPLPSHLPLSYSLYLSSFLFPLFFCFSRMDTIYLSLTSPLVLFPAPLCPELQTSRY